MKLDISSIIKDDGGTININMEEAATGLSSGIGTVSFIGPASFVGHITNRNGKLLLEGVAKTSYKTICDRCAIDIEQELVIDIKEDIIESEESEDRETTEENYLDDRYTLSGSTLDLDRIISDCIVTSIPTSRICNENCSGLCNVCGAQISGDGCNCNDTDAVDSRFEILKGYFD